jgi:hypothetical protein
MRRGFRETRDGSTPGLGLKEGLRASPPTIGMALDLGQQCAIFLITQFAIDQPVQTLRIQFFESM